MGRPSGLSCKSPESASDGLLQVNLFRRGKRQKFQAGPAAIHRPHGGDLRHESLGGELRAGRKMDAEQEPGPEATLGVERAAVFRQIREGAFAAVVPIFEVHRDLDRDTNAVAPLRLRRDAAPPGLLDAETVPAGLALKGNERKQRKQFIQEAPVLAPGDQ